MANVVDYTFKAYIDAYIATVGPLQAKRSPDVEELDLCG
jgi:hypothetical protein